MRTSEIPSQFVPRSAAKFTPGSGRSIAPAGWALAPSPARSQTTADLQWDLLLACVAGYLLAAVGRVHQLFPGLEALRPMVVTGLLAIALYVVDRRAQRDSRLLWTSTTKWLMALLVWMVLSVPTSLWPGYSFDLLADNFIKTVLMYLVVAGAVRGTRDVERLAAVYLLAATAYASVALLRFDIGAGDAWRASRLYYYDSNDFATFAVTAMPFGLYFAHGSQRARSRLLALAALAVLTIAFVHTWSRGGFVALLAVAVFILLRYRAIALRWRVSAFALVAVVLLGTATDQYWQQMGSILSDADYNRTDESGRLQIWRRGVGYMLDHPILGVGPNAFGVAEGTLSPFAARQQFGIGVRWNAAHNSFLQAGAELGVPGLVFFVAIIVSAFRALRRSSRRDAALSTRPEIAQALTGSLIGFAVGAFFLSLAYSEMLYMLLALAVGLQKVTVDRYRWEKAA
jgi:putative inorganic carbon (HCO3(-)) transporter